MLQPARGPNMEHNDLVWSGDTDRASISRAVDRGTMRRLGVGLYTRSLDEPSIVVRRNLWAIVAREFPGAVIVDRSARAGGQPVDNQLHVVHPRRRPVELAGVTIVPRAGAAAQQYDMALPGGIFLASEARTMLESLAKATPTRLSRTEVEQWLDELCAAGDDRRLNKIRDQARELAIPLRTATPFAVLSRLISAALTTGNAPRSTSAAFVARSAGEPFDARRVERFEALVAALQHTPPRPLPELPIDRARRALLPFYEAYFSNFIEGTEFTLDEAEAIVFRGAIPETRPADAHDVTGTYALVFDETERRSVTRNADEFIAMLKRRHAIVMGGRPDKRPGEFKHIANRAGSTEFVAPSMVEGTLRRGFELSSRLIDPFQRGVYLSYVVTEVHPFLDGNGRVARITMNAELTSGGQVRVIVPTVYRLNYIAALKAATQNNVFEPIIAVLEFAQRFTARVDFTSRATAEADLTRVNALREPYEAEQAGVRLQLP
jgi:Fic/DOC family